MKDWFATRVIDTVSLRPFNLKVGDKVIFMSDTREDSAPSLRGQLRKGKVIGIYPHIFNVEYTIGENNDIVLRRSFRRLDYQLGEVTKYDAD